MLGTPPTYNTQGDVLVKLVLGQTRTLDDVSTPGSLTVQLDAGANAVLQVYDCSRFGGGVFAQGGTTRVAGQLYSDVTTSPDTTLVLAAGRIFGNVDIGGRFEPAGVGDYYGSPYYWSSSITGNYRQASTARLVLPLRFDHFPDARPSLDVSGVATFDGGTVELTAASFLAENKAFSEWLLHADLGIVVHAAPTWVLPVFVTGSARFTTNDLYFDAVRASTASVITAASVGDAVTLGTATHVDQAFDQLDRIVTQPPGLLSQAQRQMIASASAIQGIRSYDRARISFDSLSGQAHASVGEVLLDQALDPLRSYRDSRADAIAAHAGEWSVHERDSAAFNQSGHIGASYQSRDHVAGFSIPFDNGLLAELGFGWTDGIMQFERLGGEADVRAPFARLQLTYRGDDGWYATGALGHTHAKMDMNRRLDPGDARLHTAQSRRDMDIASIGVEAGRDIIAGEALITPFFAIGHASLRDHGFTENGDTGFELTATPSTMSRTIATLGARYTRDWNFDGRNWMRLDLSGRYQQSISDAGNPAAFAFTGTPDARFSLDGMPVSGGQGWLDARLSMPGGGRWWWSLDYTRPVAGPRTDSTMMFRLQGGF